MYFTDLMWRFFLRFRYPGSLPEEVACALGIELPNRISFDELVKLLSASDAKPSKLQKFMSKEMADAAFSHAQCKEHFKHSSIFSFYFTEGWLEFLLEYDENSRLRRLYMQHKNIDSDRGIEIKLTNPNQ